MAIIVFDISQRSSFNSLDKWVQDVRNERGGDVLIMIAANKIDLVDKRSVSSEEFESKARDLNVQALECSAKTGANIKQLFKALAQELPGLQEASMAKAKDTKDDRIKLTAAENAAKAKEDGCKC